MRGKEKASAEVRVSFGELLAYLGLAETGAEDNANNYIIGGFYRD